MNKALLALASCLWLGCDSGTTQMPNKMLGTIAITSPANMAAVTANAANPDVPVAFTVANFTLKAPGTCAGAADCGHVHIVVDGPACNDPKAPGPYNVDGQASPLNIALDHCPTIAGTHVVTAELHNDDHSNYKNAAGVLVSNSITITAQ